MNWKRFFCSLGWHSLCRRDDYIICSTEHKLANSTCINIYTKPILECKVPPECQINHTPPPFPELSKPAIESCYDLLDASRRHDWKRWLKRVADTGANGVRFFAIQTFSQREKDNSPTSFQPYPQVGYWKHSEVSYRFPLFQLRKNGKPFWNQEWWNRYREILEEMKQLGLVAYIVGWTWTDLKKDKKEKYFHPWYCSKERQKCRGGTWGNCMRKYKEDLIKELIRVALEIEVDFIYEPVNEFDTKDYDDEFTVEYHKWLVDEAYAAGAKVVLASAMRCGDEIKAQVDYYSAHGFVTPERVREFYNQYGSDGFMISGDGGFNGHGRPDAKGRRGASPKEMRGICKLVYKHDFIGHERFDRGMYFKDNNRANLDDYDGAAMMAYVDEARKIENA